MDPRRMFALGAAAALVTATAAEAQSLGTFRWQLQPYCNVLTLAVTQVGSAYRVEGRDDLCGAGKAASAIGTAYLNPDGTVGFGLTVVPPQGPAVQVTAAIALSGLSGTWSDSDGNLGIFAFRPGPPTPGSPRPVFTPTLPGVVIGPGLTVTAEYGPDDEELRRLSVDPTFIRSTTRVTFPGLSNTGLGQDVMPTVTGSGNTAVGYLTLKALTSGSANVGAGNEALAATTSGGFNVAVGNQALRHSIDGSSNVALGAGALFQNTNGQQNIAIGRNAMVSGLTGSRNIAIGDSAGPNTTGTDNIMIGVNAGFDTAGSGTNNIYIGSRGFLPDVNTIRIGNSTHVGAVITGIAGQTTIGGVPVLVNAGGRLGTVTSSQRFKTDIAAVRPEELTALQALRPVRFVYKPEYSGGGRELQYGLIAEEVAETMPDLVVRDDAGAPWTVRYQLLAPLLLADAQRLERERAALAARVQVLENERDGLRATIETLAGRIAALESTSPPR